MQNGLTLELEEVGEWLNQCGSEIWSGKRHGFSGKKIMIEVSYTAIQQVGLKVILMNKSVERNEKLKIHCVKRVILNRLPT